MNKTQKNGNVDSIELAAAEQQKSNLPAIIISADERLEKANLFMQLGEKFKAIKASKNKLDSFSIGADTGSAKFVLSDGKIDFSSSNTEVIQCIVEVIKSTINQQLSAVEAQIKDFKI